VSIGNFNCPNVIVAPVMRKAKIVVNFFILLCLIRFVSIACNSLKPETIFRRATHFGIYYPRYTILFTNSQIYNIEFFYESSNTTCILTAGGGGGAPGSSDSTDDKGGGGGGGGETLSILFPDYLINTNYSITIGSGGAGGVYLTSGGQNGISSDMSFNTLYTAHFGVGCGTAPGVNGGGSIYNGVDSTAGTGGFVNSNGNNGYQDYIESYGVSVISCGGGGGGGGNALDDLSKSAGGGGGGVGYDYNTNTFLTGEGGGGGKTSAGGTPYQGGLGGIYNGGAGGTSNGSSGSNGTYGGGGGGGSGLVGGIGGSGGAGGNGFGIIYFEYP
jgi:hypothetical protein